MVAVSPTGLSTHMHDITLKRTYSVAEAMEVIGIGRTNLYRLSGAGVLQPRKIGKKTVFLVDEVHDYIASLPMAHIRPDQRKFAT